MTVEITQHKQNTTCKKCYNVSLWEGTHLPRCGASQSQRDGGKGAVAGGRTNLQKAHETVGRKFRGVDLQRVTEALTPNPATRGREGEAVIAKQNSVRLTLRLGTFPAAWNERIRTEIGRAMIEKWVGREERGGGGGGGEATV